MISRRRRKGERRARTSLALTERDRRIIRDVYRFRFLSSSQLQQRFFPSKSKADRRLRALYDHGYLDRIDRPAEQGSSELVYALSARGADLLAEEQGIRKGDLTWKASHNRVSPHTLDHELEIVRFHLAMDRSVQCTPGVEWISWQSRLTLPSSADWRLYDPQASGRAKTLIPDAFFMLRTPKGRTGFFLELDRGTESTRVFRRKILAYDSAHGKGEITKSTGLKACRVLTVTSSTQRCDHLLRAANALKSPMLFWFLVEDHLADNLLTDAQWTCAGEVGQLVALVELHY